MDPTSVGIPKNSLVLGKHSGRHAFRERVVSLGYNLNDEQVEAAFNKFKALADKKKEVFDADLEALMAQGEAAGADEYQLEFLSVTSSLAGVPTATVRLRRGEETLTEAGTGVGSVDAVYRTIDKLVSVEHRLVDYVVSAVTGGTDALGEVSIGIQYNGNFHTGRAVATDIVEGSARAYLNAINRAISKSTVQRVEAP